MPFVVGETIGPYRLTEQLGQGGMATVFKAYHASLDRYVAIKALHPAFMEDPNFLARFQREARVVAKLEHRSIVPVYDYAEHEGRPYLVMKFIEGQTLKARLQRGSPSSAQILEIADAVGAALAYAHQQGILHRDVKPSNVILANDGKIYLADFGLARIAAAGESTLSSDTVLGTPQYISPEQALGKRDLDAGTDIYSLGVVFYEMVVGKVPFSGDTPFAVIHDHIYTPLPPPRHNNPEVSEAVERVLLKALAKERSDRYDDVTAMVAAFRQALAPQAAGSPSPFLSETEVATKAPLPAAWATSPNQGTTSGVRRPVDQTAALPNRKRLLGRIGLAGCLGLLALFVCTGLVMGSLYLYRRGGLGGLLKPTRALAPTGYVAAPAGETTPGDAAAGDAAAEPSNYSSVYFYDEELPGWELAPEWDRDTDQSNMCASLPTRAIWNITLGDGSAYWFFSGNGVLRWGVNMQANPLRGYLITLDMSAQEASLAKQSSENEIGETLASGHFEFNEEYASTPVNMFIMNGMVELSINGEKIWTYEDEQPPEPGWISFENIEGVTCLAISASVYPLESP